MTTFFLASVRLDRSANMGKEKIEIGTSDGIGAKISVNLTLNGLQFEIIFNEGNKF